MKTPLFTYSILEEQSESPNSPAEHFHDLITAAASRHKVSDFWERLEQAPSKEPQPLATDPDLVDVHLSREHWETHILDRHPEVARYRQHILRTIEMPDRRFSKGFDEKNRYFVQYYADIPDHVHEYQNRKRMAVKVKYTFGEKLPGRYSGLISTAYLETW